MESQSQVFYITFSCFFHDFSNTDEFWDFDFETLAEYDLKKTLDYVSTPQKNEISIICHSTGCNQWAFLLAKYPNFNRDRLVPRTFMLAPMIVMNHSPLMSIYENVIFAGKKNYKAEIQAKLELPWFAQDNCNNDFCKKLITENSLVSLDQFNMDMVETIFRNLKQGASLKSLHHIYQVT